MKKVINIIQTILVLYLISILFVILAITIFNDSFIIIDNGKVIMYVIFIILPVPILLAMYMYLGVKDLKHDSKRIEKAYKLIIEDKDEQIFNHTTLDNIRKEYVNLDNKIPFNKDLDTTEQIIKCDNCNREMREAPTMYICDYCKKRKKKEAL